MQYKKAEEPQAEKLVSIEGTGTHKALPKGSLHQVPQADADALIESGRAKASKKEVAASVPAGERDRPEQITPADVDNDAATKPETDAQAKANVGAEQKEDKTAYQTKEDKTAAQTKASKGAKPKKK